LCKSQPRSSPQAGTTTGPTPAAERNAPSPHSYRTAAPADSSQFDRARGPTRQNARCRATPASCEARLGTARDKNARGMRAWQAGGCLHGEGRGWRGRRKTDRLSHRVTSAGRNGLRTGVDAGGVEAFPGAAGGARQGLVRAYYRRACLTGVTIQSVARATNARRCPEQWAPAQVRRSQGRKRVNPDKASSSRKSGEKLLTPQGELNAKWLSGVAHGSRRTMIRHFFSTAASSFAGAKAFSRERGPRRSICCGIQGASFLTRSISALGSRSQSGFQQETLGRAVL